MINKKQNSKQFKQQNLPHWHLGDLYAAPDDPALVRDLNMLLEHANAFQKKYQGKIVSLQIDLLAAIQAYQHVEEISAKLMSYAYLRHATDSNNPLTGSFLQNIQDKTTQASSKTLFFMLEINKIPETNFVQILKDVGIKKFAGWLRMVRAFAPHQLSDDLEKFSLEKSLSGRQAWIRLYDETMAKLRFNIAGQSKTQSEAFHMLQSPIATERQEAACEIARVLQENINLLSLITNTLAKDKETDDVWRRFNTPASARHLANQVEPYVVDTLVATVRQSYPKTAHRYYQLKKQLMGAKKLAYWDRNAPLFRDTEQVFTWPQACDLVLDSFASFSPQFRDIAKKFIDNRWIDAAVYPGKDAGAFAHPTVPSVHPYILVNFHGSIRDVMTLAHELGHGVHQTLSAQQGFLMSEPSLPLSETASIFGEMLTFQHLLGQCKNSYEKAALLSRKIEDMLNTVVRQIAFHQFETIVHHERRQGELSPKRLGEIWLEFQNESLGPAFDLAPEYSWYWSYIPHFIHTPFYVYAYAFADCLVNSLYGVYQNASHSFMEHYIHLLSSGGAIPYQQLLLPFGIDVADGKFWQQGIGVIEKMIDQFEQLIVTSEYGRKR